MMSLCARWHGDGCTAIAVEIARMSVDINDVSR